MISLGTRENATVLCSVATNVRVRFQLGARCGALHTLASVVSVHEERSAERVGILMLSRTENPHTVPVYITASEWHYPLDTAPRTRVRPREQRDRDRPMRIV